MLYIPFISLLLLQTFIKTGPTMDNGKKSECEENSDQSKLNSFLWTLKRDPPAYFFGTIHVPYTKVWNYIPDNTKRAFEQSENVFFELDLTDPYTITALARCQLLPNGENLSNVLPEGIYKRLKRHLEYIKLMLPSWITADQKGRGLYADYLYNTIAGNWERKRPVWVMLMVNSLTENDIKSRGIPVLDLYLAQEAERTRKSTGAVERVEEQCIPLNELNFSQVVFALNQTLLQQETYRSRKQTVSYTTDDLIEHYNCGDLNSVMFNKDTSQFPVLFNSTLPPNDIHTAQLIDEYFRNELIYKRNKRIAERVQRILKANPDTTFFFAFGAGHFLGNNTVLDMLVENGFEIQHTAPNQTIEELPPHKRISARKKQLTSAEMSSDFPFLSDVLYGDMDYLYRQRIKMERRNRKRRKKMKTKKHYNFNELWVHIDPENPSFLKQQTEENQPPVTGKEENKEISEHVSTDNWSISIHCGVYHIPLVVVTLSYILLW